MDMTVFLYGKNDILRLAKFTFVFLLFSGASFAEELPDVGERTVRECWAKGESHVAAVDCAFQRYEGLKAELHVLNKERQLEAEGLDKQIKELGMSTSPFSPMINESEMAFDAYVEKECRLQENYAQGGSYGADIAVKCMINLTQQRIDFLKRN